MEHDQVADLLALGHVGPAGQDHKRLGGLGGLRRRGRRQTEHEDGEEADNHDRRTPITSNFKPGCTRAVQSTQPSLARQEQIDRSSECEQPWRREALGTSTGSS